MPRLRGDIEGLRALAITLVVLYHAGVTALPGGFVGVDVFFVISGFLITGVLLREIQSTGRISLTSFWARRARRLVPASALALVTTALAAWLILPITAWRALGGDIVAATFYVVNWRFAERSVDYLAADADDSAILHFWSLAVEEQFYIVWPLALTLVLFLGARRRRRGTRTLPIAVALCAIGGASLVWALSSAQNDDPTAFFVTTGRLWELGVGAGLAVTTQMWGRMPKMLASWVSMCGLAAVLASALLLDAQTAWPGLATLLPTLGTAAVIAGGVGRHATIATRLLGVRPFVFLGGLSYSLYLWHWPVLVFGRHLLDDDGLTASLGLAAVSFVPAVASLYLVENPIRFHRRLRKHDWASLSLCANLMLVAAVAGLALVAAAASAPAPEDEEVVAFPGARAIGQGPVPPHSGTFIPAIQDAAADNPDVYADGCHVPPAGVDVATCVYGSPDSDVVVALVGDSHAAQWQPPLRQLAEERGWRLETYTKSGCPFADVAVRSDLTGAPYPECSEWNAAARAALYAHPPDVIIVSSAGYYEVLSPDGSELAPDASARAMVDGLARSWQGAMAVSELVVVVDTPMPGIDVPTCVAENMTNPDACAVSLDQAAQSSAARLQHQAAADVKPDLVVELTDQICPGGVCAPVIGNVLVWRDLHHLTATYGRTLSPALEGALDALPALAE